MTPWRLLWMVFYLAWYPMYEARHFLKWQLVGVTLHLCAILFSWVLARGVDLTLLNPLTYSDFGWFLFIAWHLFWVWMWVIE